MLATALTMACTDAPSCHVGAAGCQEWVIVMKPGADVQAAQAWLRREGIVVGKTIPDLRLIYVWLPRKDAAEASIRAQPWADVVTDQATPVPSH